MPVVVTGASGRIGRHAVAAFLRTSSEVRAYVRRQDAAEELRRLGAKVAVGEIDDVERLATVMTDAHTVCHLAGQSDLRDEEAGLRGGFGSVEAVLQAATRARLRRVLFLSQPGAAPDASAPLLRAKGLAERAIREADLEHVIVRTAPVYGPGHPWIEFAASARTSSRPEALVVGTGHEAVAPVFVDDAAKVLVAADDRDRLSSGTWALEGPDRVDLDDLIVTLAGGPVRIAHLRSRWRAALHDRMGRRSPVLEADPLWATHDAIAVPDAAAEFGVRLTGLAEGVRRSLASDRPAAPG